MDLEQQSHIINVSVFARPGGYEWRLFAFKVFVGNHSSSPEANQLCFDMARERERTGATEGMRDGPEPIL